MRQAIHAAGQAGTLPRALKGYRPDAAADRDAYEQELRDELDAADVTIIDLPDVGHDKVLDRIKHARKPTKDDDDQYRDILIWESVVAHLAALAKRRRKGGGIGQTILVTSNFKGFGVAADKPDVHPDLADDLEAAGLARDAVILVGHPQELIAQHLAAKDEVTERITSMLADERGLRDLLAEFRHLLDGHQVTGPMDWPYSGEIDSVLIAGYGICTRPRCRRSTRSSPASATASRCCSTSTLTSRSSSPRRRRGIWMPTPPTSSATPTGGGHISTETKTMRLPVELVWLVEKEQWDPKAVELGEGFELVDHDEDEPPQD